MSQKLLIDREQCDCCLEKHRLDTLLSVAYTDQRLLGTINTRYKREFSPEELNGASFELVHCRHCNHVFQRWVPTDEFAKIIYTYSDDRAAESLTKRTDAPLEYYMQYARLVERMAFLLGGRPHEHNILDFGSGWGYFVSMARAYGFRAQGVEISKERVEFSQILGIKTVPHIDLTKPNLFSFVHCDQTLEHLSDPAAVLASIVERLRPGGFVYIAVPNGTQVASVVKKAGGSYPLFKKLTNPLEHVNCFSHESLVNLANRLGLQLVPAHLLAQRWLSAVKVGRNGDLGQAAVSIPLRYSHSTELYFKKPGILPEGT